MSKRKATSKVVRVPAVAHGLPMAEPGSPQRHAACGVDWPRKSRPCPGCGAIATA